MARTSTAALVLFYLAFAAFSVKVKRDVARAEGLDRFQIELPRGYSAPDFALPNLQGTAVELAAEIESGELVLLDFWATWCPPCRLELPMLDTLQKRYGDRGLRVVAIDVGEDRATVEAFLNERNLSIPVLLDIDHSVATRYRIEAFPTTILLEDGKVAEVVEGLDPYLGYRIEVYLERPGPDSPTEPR